MAAGEGSATVDTASHIDDWGAKMSSLFYSYQMSATRAGRFQGRIRSRKMGDITFALIQAQPHQAHRVPVLPKGRDRFALSLQLEGHSTVSQHGRTRDLRPGDYCTYDPELQYTRVFEEPTSSFVILFPRAFLMLPENVLHEAGALVVRPDTMLPSLYSDLLLGLAQGIDSLDSFNGFRVARATIEMLSTSLLSTLNVGSLDSGSSSDQLRLAVLDYINENISDSELSAGKIAAHFYISTRYLFRLFTGEGIAQLIRDRRLTLAESKLADPSLRWMPVAQISETCGFVNPNYFSRVFREHYGIAPAQYRQMAAESAAG